MIKGTMNTTTNLFVLLIVISFIFPTTAIRYAQAATENSQESNNTGNAQESNNTGSATSSSVPENATSSSVPENATSSSVPENATSSSGSMASNNTGNEQQESSNAGNARQESNNTGSASADFVNGILAVHNRERAEFKLPPLVWNDTAAAHAKAWVEYLGAGKAGGKMVHCIEVPGWEQIEACTHHEGENIAASWPGSPAENQTKLAQALTESWVSEKPTGHYLQFVSRVTKSVGCGMITNGNLTAYYNGTSNILSCRYYPPGIDIAGCTENVPGCKAIPPQQLSNNTGNTQQLSNTTGSVPQSNNAGSVPQSNNAGSVPQSNNAGSVPQSNNAGNTQHM
jgi:hypothetical protein